MNPAFEEVMTARGKGMPEAGEVEIKGADPVLPTRFKIAEVCASVMAGIGVGVSDIWELKTGRRQKVAIDVRHAAALVQMLHMAGSCRRRVCTTGACWESPSPGPPRMAAGSCLTLVCLT